MEIGPRTEYWECRSDDSVTSQHIRKINNKEFRFTFSKNFATGHIGYVVSEAATPNDYILRHYCTGKHA